MMKIIFKNLEKSELAKELTQERLHTVFERFPDLQKSKVTVTLSMENSPQQAGADVFTVRFYSQGGRYRNIVLQKSASNLYAALADVVEHLLEKLNRFGDKIRVKQRNKNNYLGVDYDGMGALGPVTL
ncbi:MAG: HPF/RaiA family ribosome-associated protein [Oligoflexia bacterium]|nr:HPF/RaiA family ribosome-associated protein [Oligoflexia bacterium]